MESGLSNLGKSLGRRQSKERSPVETSSSQTTSIFDYTSVCKVNSDLQARDAEAGSAEWSRKSFKHPEGVDLEAKESSSKC